MKNDFLVTLDVDWAPDFVIDFVAGLLLEARVRSTWFLTHQSPAIDRLRAYPDLFHLGIHPNFLPTSSHGKTPSEVLAHCKSIVPKAISMRTHCLLQSTPLMEAAMHEAGIRVDLSLYLPHLSGLAPIPYRWKGRDLVRLPTFWEDDFEMQLKSPTWRLAPFKKMKPGLKIFNFHPIHVYMNAASLAAYEKLKQTGVSVAALRPEHVQPFINRKIGTQTLFREILDHHRRKKMSLFVTDVIGAR